MSFSNRFRVKNWKIVYRWIAILLLIQFLLGWLVIYSRKTRNNVHQLSVLEKVEETNINSPAKAGCHVPRLTPGDALLRALDLSQGIKKPSCIDDKVRLNLKFQIDRNGSLIRLNRNDSFWIRNNCTYQATDRIPLVGDFRYQIQEEVPIEESITHIPPPIQSVKITCRLKDASKEIVYEDYLTTVNPIPEILERPLPRDCNLSSCNAYSVLIFGLDSSSHMNFIRYMPAAHDYLVNRMGAVEFHGFNSLGAGTLWSVFALLTGIRLDELQKICWPKDSAPFDTCPFIWNKFKEAGYVTSYGEDWTSAGIFNTGGYTGFRNAQPVDYDFRGFMNLFHNHKLIGHALSGSLCHGSRLAFDIALDNVLKFATAFSSRPYFHFSWTTSLTHNSNPMSKFGEQYLVRALQTLHTEGLLDNTIFMLISDHGMRYGPLRKQTRQGFLEERLPIFYLVLPKKFREVYPIATSNVASNAHKLVTAYDIYATLEDILEPQVLKSGARLERRTEAPLPKRGISLFQEISADRNCDMIGFHAVYCSCLNRYPVDVNSSLVINAAISVVSHINDLLEGYPCAKLSMNGIQGAFSLNAEFDITDEKARFHQYRNQPYITKKNGNDLEIQLDTIPDNAIYYAFVSIQLDSISVQEINRISAYGNSSFCVSEKRLKPYCYCSNKPTKR